MKYLTSLYLTIVRWVKTVHLPVGTTRLTVLKQHDLLTNLVEFLKGELKRERERNEYLETLILNRTGYISSPDNTQSNSAPVINTMRRPWDEIRRELERKDRDKINKSGREKVTELEITQLEQEVL